MIVGGYNYIAAPPPPEKTGRRRGTIGEMPNEETETSSEAEHALPDGIPETGEPVRLRLPRKGDGIEMWALARASEALEANTAYCYVLLADHFRDTCVVAERNGRIVGMVAAFVSPKAPDTVFVWQVGVAAPERGRGLGKRMIVELLERPALAGLPYLEATVAPSNRPSAALFRSIARAFGAGVEIESGYAERDFPAGHEAERKFRIGPIAARARGPIQPKRNNNDGYLRTA